MDGAIATALDALSEVAGAAPVWARDPLVVVALISGGCALVTGALSLMRLMRPRADARAMYVPASSGDDPLEPRVLILKLMGDDGNAAGVRLSAVLARQCGGIAAIAHTGASPLKPGFDLDEEARLAESTARRARVGLVIWGVVDRGVTRLRLLKVGAQTPPDLIALPSHLPPPFDIAALAVVAAAGAETRVLAGMRVALAHAVGELEALLSSDRPADAHDEARLRAALSRAILALDAIEPGSGRLQAALAASAAPDERRTVEAIEWADALSRRERALARSHVGKPEPPLEELRERVEACSNVLRTWSNTGMMRRIARSEAALAHAVIELADCDGDMRGVEDVERMAEAALARRPAQANGSTDAAHVAEMTALLGAARLRLGERDARTSRLEAAERDLRAALELGEEVLSPELLTAIRGDFARALCRLGERERGSARLRAAAKLYRSSLKVDSGELSRARARAALGRTLIQVSEREQDFRAADEAVAALRMASNSLADLGAAAAATQTRGVLQRAERLYSALRSGRSVALDATAQA